MISRHESGDGEGVTMRSTWLVRLSALILPLSSVWLLACSDDAASTTPAADVAVSDTASEDLADGAGGADVAGEDASIPDATVPDVSVLDVTEADADLPDAPPLDVLPPDVSEGDVSLVDTESDDVAADVAAVDAGPPNPALDGTVPADFSVRPGVEIVTAFGVTPGTPITLYDPNGIKLVTFNADEFGQVHFSYVPKEYAALTSEAAISGDLIKDGYAVPPGDGYILRDDTPLPGGPAKASAQFRVLAVDDHPPTSLYESQELHGIHFGILGVQSGEDPQDGLNYIEMRDGVKLSAMVRLPDPAFWGDGPYPTVVEYSGYSPSNPNSPEPGSQIATLLGYASVGVNMRGSGCSGGVFDVFSPAQHADGYDVVETVARQPWVLHNKVGMVGLSYPGISELYVAYTRPPSLAAVTPLSVLLDPWIVLRPGGIYNDGFTRQWLAQRDAEAASGGQSWTDVRIASGDTVCEEHQQLRNQNLKFEEVFKALEFYPVEGFSRSIWRLVDKIDVPVYLTGGFQDEQTGPQFADMLGRFTSAPVRRFILYNGRHVDGYSPLVLTRWWEFLEIYVAKRVPRMPEWMRTIGGEEFSKNFDSTGLTFEPDRFLSFADDDYTGVKAAYELQPEVRVLFESGGGMDQPGAPKLRFETSFDAWPPPVATTTSLFFGPGGTLVASAPAETGTDSYAHDAAAGKSTFFGPKGYSTTDRMWDLAWTRFADGDRVSYTTPTLTAPLILGGPGFVDLWLSSDAADVNLQVTITELRSDGQEVLVTTGWHRVGHRKIDPTASLGNFIQYTFAEEDFALLAPAEVLKTQVPIPSIAHVFRPGSRLRATISTPGRDHGTWEFANPTYDGTTPTHHITWGGATPSALHFSVLQPSDIPGEIPTDYPACPGLRGQPCRAVETVPPPG